MMNARDLEENARRLLRAKILYHHNSLLEFDRLLGDPPNTVSQRLRGRVRLTLFQLLRYLGHIDLDPVEFFAELYGGSPASRSERPAPTTDDFVRLMEQIAEAGETAGRLLHGSTRSQPDRHT